MRRRRIHAGVEGAHVYHYLRGGGYMCMRRRRIHAGVEGAHVYHYLLLII
jgi:hypothetical protein